jgi:hypothetical protein
MWVSWNRSGMMMVSDFPTISSAVYPNIFSAARFQSTTSPCALIVTMPSGVVAKATAAKGTAIFGARSESLGVFLDFRVFDLAAFILCSLAQIVLYVWNTLA